MSDGKFHAIRQVVVHPAAVAAVAPAAAAVAAAAGIAAAAAAVAAAAGIAAAAAAVALAAAGVTKRCHERDARQQAVACP